MGQRRKFAQKNTATKLKRDKAEKQQDKQLMKKRDEAARKFMVEYVKKRKVEKEKAEYIR